MNGSARITAAAAAGGAWADSDGPGAAPLERPPLPPGFDDSRAAERRVRPGGWRFDGGAARRGLAGDRRAARHPPLPARPARPTASLDRLLEAAHRAPSVGLMQPWRFVVVRQRGHEGGDAGARRTRAARPGGPLRRSARAHYLDLKVEGIREAPVSICVCCDRGAGGREVLGRHTIPDTDLYSTCLAIENLWLAARAEGIGVGWVSFYRPDDVRAPARPARARGAGRLAVRRLPGRAAQPPRARGGWLAAAAAARRASCTPSAGAAARRRRTRGRGGAARSRRAARAPGWWRRARRGGRSRRPAAALPRPRRLRRARQAPRQPGCARARARALGDRPAGRRRPARRARHPRVRRRSRRRGTARQPVPRARRRAGRRGGRSRRDGDRRARRGARRRAGRRRRRPARRRGRPGSSTGASPTEAPTSPPGRPSRRAAAARGGRGRLRSSRRELAAALRPLVARRDRDREHDGRRRAAGRAVRPRRRRRSAAAAPGSTPGRRAQARPWSSRARGQRPAIRRPARVPAAGRRARARRARRGELGAAASASPGDARRLRDRGRGAGRVPPRAGACATT